MKQTIVLTAVIEYDVAGGFTPEQVRGVKDYLKEVISDMEEGTTKVRQINTTLVK